MAFMVIIRGLRPSFYILLGFRLGSGFRAQGLASYRAKGLGLRVGLARGWFKG